MSELFCLREVFHNALWSSCLPVLLSSTVFQFYFLVLLQAVWCCEHRRSTSRHCGKDTLWKSLMGFFTLASLWLDPGITPVSLRSHSGFSLSSLRFYQDFALVPLWLRSDFVPLLLILCSDFTQFFTQFLPQVCSFFHTETLKITRIAGHFGRSKHPKNGVLKSKIAPKATRCFLRLELIFSQKSRKNRRYPHSKRLIAGRIASV